MRWQHRLVLHQYGAPYHTRCRRPTFLLGLDGIIRQGRKAPPGGMWLGVSPPLPSPTLPSCTTLRLSRFGIIDIVRTVSLELCSVGRLICSYPCTARLPACLVYRPPSQRRAQSMQRCAYVHPTTHYSNTTCIYKPRHLVELTYSLTSEDNLVVQMVVEL